MSAGLSSESRARMEKARKTGLEASWSRTSAEEMSSYEEGFADGFAARDVEAEERRQALRVSLADALTLKDDAYVYQQAAEDLLQASEERVRVLTKALTEARADVLGVLNAGFDSTRREVATRAIERLDAALAVSSTENEEEQK